MNRAVRNERLAVQQRLTRVYRQRLEEMSRGMDELWAGRIRKIEGLTAMGRSPMALFDLLTRPESDTGPQGTGICDALVIFDARSQLVYPIRSDRDQLGDLPEAFAEIRRVEFVEGNYRWAAELYREIADNAADDYIRVSARLGQIRCLRQANDVPNAMVLCRELAYGNVPQDAPPAALSLRARAGLLWLDLKTELSGDVEPSDWKELLDAVITYQQNDEGSAFRRMPSETRIFLLRKLLERIQGAGIGPRIHEWSGGIARARHLLAAEELSMRVLNQYYVDAETPAWSEGQTLELISLLSLALDRVETGQWEWGDQLKQQLSAILNVFPVETHTFTEMSRSSTRAWFDTWPQHGFQRINLPAAVGDSDCAFGMVHRSTTGLQTQEDSQAPRSRTYLILIRPEQLDRDFAVHGGDLQSLGLYYRITDAARQPVNGLGRPLEDKRLTKQSISDQPALLQIPLGRFFPGWTMEVFCEDIAVFDRAAHEQTALTIWIGVLAIVVIMASGGLAARAVNDQIRTNRLKNDFIATVTHELKTPLSSMRLLGDTLLESRAADRQQTLEYLQLMSHENERLSRLIDHFLSFSRMERNKQAFMPTRTHPAKLARAAAEALQTKFGQGQCDFHTDISDDLPSIQADEDAMITVLINLLDNAYKYSREPRQIRLQVTRRNGRVSFSVTDNGIGLSRRSIGKIFKRFYQVDRSLVRAVGGCGLGLSIAQYIVKAHKGRITVTSRLGKGSTFSVTLPVDDA